MELANPNDAVASAPEGASKVVKTLRRLAQNREAAKRSRLRKKAYIKQLESSKVRLTQLEQEIQRSQVFDVGRNAFMGGVKYLEHSDAAALFDMEYGRWLEEHQQLAMELRNATLLHEDHQILHENDLRFLVNKFLGHYDQLMNLKVLIAKSDTFHITSGAWTTPAERFFMWIGGFRPSEIIKIMLSGHVEPSFSGQQVVGLQKSTHEAEEALSQGLEALHVSLSETVTWDSLAVPPNMNDYMAHMAFAIDKLSTLQGFLEQAEYLRQQTLYQLNQILTAGQAGRCFLAIAEYFHRLRALSSLWLQSPTST